MNESGQAVAGWRSLTDALGRALVPLDGEELCANARRRTGLCDFGDPPLEPALSELFDSLGRDAELHPVGRFLMRSHLQGLLETRLRLVEAWKGQSCAPIRRPVFITGMPRSGSTFLHELLAEDPDNRAPRVWEVMFPLAEGSPRWRSYKTDACLWWFRRLAPGADLVHPMRAWTPHECVAIQSYTLLSEEFVSTCRVPAYEAFLHAADLTPAYLWERRFLQHLQSGSPPRRWVLKSPDHVFGLEQLFAVFPDAYVIQTHRNPLEVLRSLAELNKVVRGAFVWPEERASSEARDARGLAGCMERFVQFRDAHPELAGRFIDVHYGDLVSYPVETVQRAYAQLGCPLSELAARRMRQLAANRSPYRGQLAALGSIRGSVLAAEAPRFERYCSRFSVPC